MLFHTGALWRLNELGWLPKISRISSVSGGSITAGVLASRWNRLNFRDGCADNFATEIVDPIRAMAGRTADIPIVLRGVFTPGRSVGEVLARTYRKRLFGEVLITELDPTGPDFVFTATNLQDGSLWWFHRRSGAQTPLATAVAASSASPPFLSPITILNPLGGEDIVLSDAGVYDNLGLDPVVGQYGTVLVSDCGRKLHKTESVARDWLRQLVRVVDVMDNQVRELRRRSLLKSYVDRTFDGAYWSSYSNIENFDLPDCLPANFTVTQKLAELPTRLMRFTPADMSRLINWGYAVCDAGMRRWVDPQAIRPPGFPYPQHPLN